MTDDTSTPAANETSAVTAGSTSIGGGSGAVLAVLIVWIVGFFHVAMSAEVGAAVAVLLTGVGAAIGAYGIKGCITIIWDGRAAVARKRPAVRRRR